MNFGSIPVAEQSSQPESIIIYVHMDATGANDGTSWENAYTYLQPAMKQAASGDQVWVASGRYYPTTRATGTILFVDVEATGANEGSSWANAFTDLQPAIEAAEAGAQVWVAAGTYYPSVEHCGTGSPRYRSIQLKNAVGVYGGFDPSTDVGWDDRDWVANDTILSGDISHHVFRRV